jgi:basic membrane lipoprotein Med (substrate-binding protein (PBP1-ABC) superfamily)
MKKNVWLAIFNLVLISAFALAGCAPATAVPQPTAAPAQPTAAPAQPTAAPKGLKVGLVTDVGGVNDKSFNQSAWAGVQKAAKDFGFDAQYIQSTQPTDYEKNIDQFATEKYDVIVTVGFLMGDATALKAKQYPNIKFAIIDNAYFPTKGQAYCDDTIKDCYADGGLTNVTSLMFQEDQVGFLAGVVAGGITKSNVVCTVSGMEIPPVVRYVVGFQNGAKWMNPNAQALNVYIPSFTDPAKGKETGQAMIGQGCDVVFGVGGNTGNGGLLAASEKGLAAIGVDVDQYNTYPEVKSALVTSAQKNVDVAVYEYLKAVNAGTNKAGVVTANIQNGGVGLAPYHDWDSKVPDAVKAKVQEATDGLKAGTLNSATPAAPGAAATAAPAQPTAAPTAAAAAGGGKTLTIWHGYHTGGTEEATINQIADAYRKANPDVTLNVLEVPFDQLFNKWETEVAAGGGPDMFTAPNDSLGKEVRAGLVLDITDKMQGKLDGVAQLSIDPARHHRRPAGAGEERQEAGAV